jgi:RHS repeat-associated protein
VPAATWLPPVVDYGEARRVTGTNGKERLERATIFDRHGNALRVITPRSDGTKVLLAFQDNQYDVRGRLVGESSPYFAGATPSWTTYEYDPLNRRKREQRANGAVTTIAYDQLTQTRTNARGFTTRIVYTPEGKPETVERADKGIVRLAYDAMERVVSVTSPNDVTMRFGYDGADNRILTQDPNSGTLEYRYDGFGQLREERAGNKQWAELDYDALGRPARVWREDQETLWSYDQPGAIGKPRTITLAGQNGATPLKYSETFEYDAALRLRRSTTDMHAPGTLDPAFGTDFRGNYTFEYGPYSELAQIFYPKSGLQPTLVVARDYDSETGQLVRVRDARTAAGITLWRLASADASGRARDVFLGNGAREVRSYQTTTGRLESMRVLSARGATLLSAAYQYDPLGNILSRGKPGKPEERFDYDVQNRLVTFSRTGSGKVEVRFDQDDRITWKTGVGTYRYASDPKAAEYCLSPDQTPNALCAIEDKGVVTDSFLFDQYGNMVSRSDPSNQGKGSRVDYAFDNHVSRITQLGVNGVPDNQQAAEYFYGPSGQRILSREMRCGGVVCEYRRKETVQLGSYERVTVQRGGAGSSRVVTDRYYVRADDGVFMSLDAIDRRNAKGGDRRGPTETHLYLHRDHIGSLVLVSNKDGKKAMAVRYDPWGRTSDIDSTNDHDGGLGIEASWTRGFTGQDHVSQFDLIHMTGRVYDPELGLFLSVDPFMSDPEAGGDLNPYLYAQGNPLTVTDPTGFWGLSDVARDIGNAIGNAGRAIGRGLGDIGRGLEHLWHEAEKWVGQNWREIVTVAVIVAVTVATAGTGTGPIVVAMAAGAAGAATQTALYGGSVQDIIAAGIVGAVIGAFSGAIGASGLDWYYKAIAQGVVSGAQSSATNGSFERGFVIGALSRVSPSDVVGKSQNSWAVAGRIVTRAVVNGTISQMQGGQFGVSAIVGLGTETWAEAKSGHWWIRSKIESFSWFAPGDPNDFGASDLIAIYTMVTNQRADGGIWLLAQSGGEPNDLVRHIQQRYDNYMRRNSQTRTIQSDPALSNSSTFSLIVGACPIRAANDNLPLVERARMYQTTGAANRLADSETRCAHHLAA